MQKLPVPRRTFSNFVQALLSVDICKALAIPVRSATAQHVNSQLQRQGEFSSATNCEATGNTERVVFERVPASAAAVHKCTDQVPIRCIYNAHSDISAYSLRADVCTQGYRDGCIILPAPGRFSWCPAVSWIVYVHSTWLHALCCESSSAMCAQTLTLAAKVLLSDSQLTPTSAQTIRTCHQVIASCTPSCASAHKHPHPWCTNSSSQHRR